MIKTILKNHKEVETKGIRNIPSKELVIEKEHLNTYFRTNNIEDNTRDTFVYHYKVSDISWGVPSNEVWYETMYDTLIPTSSFLAPTSNPIVSNTYANGIGKLTFTSLVGTLPPGFIKNNKELIGVFLPNTLTSIGTAGFDGCSNLKKGIILPKSLNSMDTYVFKDTGIEVADFSLTTITTLKSGVLSGCPLKVIKLPSTMAVIESLAIPSSALIDATQCTSLLTMPNDTQSVVVVPNDMKAEWEIAYPTFNILSLDEAIEKGLM